MRKCLIAIILYLGVVAPAAVLAQFYFRPNMPPVSVIGNPFSVNAPAQAIPFTQLNTAINAGNLLNPTLPPTVDLNNLPPQTIVGNQTSNPAALGFITFAQLLTLSARQNLPTTMYNTYDPTNIPGLAAVGNVSTTADALALPISLGILLGGALLLEDNISFLLQEDNASHICLVLVCL